MSCMPVQHSRPVPSAYFKTTNSNDNTTKHAATNSRESDKNAVVVQPFNFPETKQIWWDRKPQGSSELLHLTSKRNIRVYLSEKTLRLAIKHLTKSPVSPYECFFIGSLFVDSREDAVEVHIDRFDPGRDFTQQKDGVKVKVPSTVVPGDKIVPVKLVKGLMGADQMVTHSKQDFHNTFETMSGKISGQEPLSLSNYLNISGCCYAHTDDSDMIINLQVGAVTMATSILATPVNPVPIIPTALARNLTGPLRISDVEGAPKCGFLTMDHTRKLLLLLESDPKAYTLPLVGLWVSGPFTIHHPYIWASCVRFLQSTTIKERVLVSDNTFLLVHYSPAQIKPIFWECTQQDNLQASPFDLYTCYENLHLPQVATSQYPEPVCLELLPAADTMNRLLFDQAVTTWNRQSTSDINNMNGATTTNKVETGPVEPRPLPSPYPQQNKVMMPIVPEVSLSLSFDESSFHENTANSSSILPAKNHKLGQPVCHPTEQENRAPMNMPHRQVGKHILVSQSPQREPLKTITAQHINTDSVSDKRSPHPSTIKTAPIKRPTPKQTTLSRQNSVTNGNHHNKMKTSVNTDDNNFSSDDVSTVTRNQEANGGLSVENGALEKMNKQELANKPLDKNSSVLNHSELCDSGVGNSTKDDSFPEEDQSKTDLPDPYHMIMKQDQQIKELQQQINLLMLKQSLSQFSANNIPTPPPTPATNTPTTPSKVSTGSNTPPPTLTENIGQRTVGTNTPTLPPTEIVDKRSVGTNTPTLPPAEVVEKKSVGTNTSTYDGALVNNTDTTLPRGKGREENEIIGNRTCFSPTRTRDDHSIHSDLSYTEESPQCSSSRCDAVVDIQNDTTRTLALSLHAVDISDYSPGPSTSMQNKSQDDSTIVLGESASMLQERQSRPSTKKYDSLLLRNEKQFYDNLLNKVKEFLSSDANENKTPNVSTMSDNKALESAVPTRAEVTQATEQELARLKDTHGNESNNKILERQSPPSTTSSEIIPGLPRLNVVSFTDLSLSTSVLQLNASETRHLGSSQFDEYRTSDNDYNSTSNRNPRAKSDDMVGGVNCTWNNLSMATQDFLHRYNFTGRKEKKREEKAAPLGCSTPPSTPEPPEDTDRILDIERLRKLPKLL